MFMFYAENPHTGERGIFLSLDEFMPYYRNGWRGTEETNKAAANVMDYYEQYSDWLVRNMKLDKEALIEAIESRLGFDEFLSETNQKP